MHPLTLVRSTSHFHSRRKISFQEKSQNLVKIVQELHELQGKCRGGGRLPSRRGLMIYKTVVIENMHFLDFEDMPK